MTKNAGRIKQIKKVVSAHYCDNIPSINVKGQQKHMNLLPHELRTYEVGRYTSTMYNNCIENFQ